MRQRLLVADQQRGVVGLAHLRAASAGALEAWSASLALELQRKGITDEKAGPLADLLVSGLEGARVVARATRSREPLENMGDALASLPAVAQRQADRPVRSRPAAPRGQGLTRH